MLRQLTYKVIASKLTEGIESDREKALNIFRYVHQHLYAPPKSKPAGKSILEVLTRNIAWCDQQSDIMAVLSRRFWVGGGYVTLYGYDHISHHTVCVLKLDGKYRMFDPLHGYIFYTKNGEIATLEDIQEKNRELQSGQFEAWHRLTGDVAYDYFKLYEPKYKWDMHIPGTPIWLKYVDYYYDIFGDPFLALFQELYFRVENTPLFLRARLKHLVYRFESAIEDYTEIIKSGRIIQSEILLIDYDRVTEDILKAEAMFFRGQAYWDMKAYEKCIVSLTEFLRDYPNNRWNELAFYYLGDCYEKIGEFNKARTFYSKISKAKIHLTPAVLRLMKLSRN